MSDHYFSADPDSIEKRQPVTATVWGQRLDLESASGVFAAGRLDIGTAALFRETEAPTTPGTYLDLGCGYGVIACAIARAVPQAKVWAVDVNARALRLCGDNARRLGVPDRVIPTLPDGVPLEVEFDEIWSNPPIRVGKPALHALLLTWLPRLTPEGRALLVVGKNLGADSLQRWIAEQGYRCERTGSSKGFRILQVTSEEDRREARSPSVTRALPGSRAIGASAEAVARGDQGDVNGGDEHGGVESRF